MKSKFYPVIGTCILLIAIWSWLPIQIFGSSILISFGNLALNFILIFLMFVSPFEEDRLMYSRDLTFYQIVKILFFVIILILLNVELMVNLGNFAINKYFVPIIMLSSYTFYRLYKLQQYYSGLRPNQSLKGSA